MIGHLLIGVLAELVFKWASSTGKHYQAEVARYMGRQGLVVEPETKEAPAK